MARRLRNIIGPIFHVVVCVHHLYAIMYSNKKKDFSQVTDQRILDMEKFAPVYFTSWNMIIQTVYFILAMVYDVLHIFSPKADLKDKIQLYKGYIFTSLVFPCSLFVSTMFWSVYSINREWVLPEVLDEYVPDWLNHSLHTNIVVFLVIEVLIVNQLLPSFKSAFIGLSILSGIYDTLFDNNIQAFSGIACIYYFGRPLQVTPTVPYTIFLCLLQLWKMDIWSFLRVQLDRENPLHALQLSVYSLCNESRNEDTEFQVYAYIIEQATFKY
ncbi:hypothetical protein NQ317_011488 [Molorchus minor]|uniref:Uncharacterized protein n=1 Tax=Molorchus minor TaxID=1323400 RepID=A0ABQ9IW84_9CUCU|nr:hypothetical protein NQ317_011488 [Molorchus minor]